MGLLDILRNNSPRRIKRSAEGDITTPDVDQFMGYMLYQQWLQNAMTQWGQEAGVYGNIGMYPTDFLGGNFDESKAIKSLPYKSYEEQVRAQKESERFSIEQQRLDEEFRRFQSAENSRNAALDRELTRQVEMGRISVQEKEIQLGYARMASEERIAQARLKLDEDRNKIELQRVGIEKYGVDVTRELGLRREGREDFLANLQKAGMEAELAARPRDYIKLAFLRAGQSMPQSLSGLSGPPPIPSYTPSTYTAPQPPLPQAPQAPPQAPPQGAPTGAPRDTDELPYGAYRATDVLHRLRRQASGGVSEGPHLSTVGEEGEEYSLLAPGSVVAPKDPNEPATPANAIKAIMRQLMQEGINPEAHPELNHVANRELGKADTGAITGAMAVSPTAKTIPVPNQLVAEGMQTWEDVLRRLQDPARGLYWFNYINRLWGSKFSRISDMVTAFNHYAAAERSAPPAPPPAPPTRPDETVPTKPNEPSVPIGNHPLDKNPELANIPFIKYLREQMGAQAYPGAFNPQDPNVRPINPYNPNVFFTLQKSRPSDIQMVEGYQDTFGLDPDDWKFDAAQTAGGYGLVPAGARAAFRPFFR